MHPVRLRNPAQGDLVALEDEAEVAYVEPLRIVVDARIRIPIEGLPSGARSALRSAFTHANPSFAANRRMRIRDEVPRVIETFVDDGRTLSLPRGGVGRVREVLAAFGVRRTFVDERQEGDEALAGEIPAHRRTLRPYQREAFSAVLAKENALVIVPGGGGKTTVAFGLAAHLKLPTLILVRERKLFEQWAARAHEELGVDPDSLGRIGAGEVKLRPLTVGTIGTVRTRMTKELLRYFGMIICDEIQGGAASTYFEVVDKFPARYRVGLTGEVRRKDKKEFLIYDLFGKPVYEVEEEALVTSNAVVDVESRMISTGFVAPWYFGGTQFGILLDRMTESRERNEFVLRTIVGELADPIAGQAFVFSHRIEHCAFLARELRARGIAAGVCVGDSAYASESAASLAAVRAGTLRVLVGTLGSIGAGIDVPSLTHAFATTPIVTNRSQFKQARWRLSRLGKSTARMCVFYEPAIHGLQAVRNLLSWGRTVLVRVDSGWVDGREFLKASAA